MFKMGLYCLFGHLKHKLWPKERPGVKLPVWLSTRKVGNRPDLLGYRQCATYHWKAFDKSYNFVLHLTSIWGLLAKLWGSKVAGVPVGVILGVPGEKSHLDVGPVESCRVYYKGEGGGGFPQVRAVVSLVCPCCPWLILAPKVLQVCTDHFVWVVCRPVWVNKTCQLFLVPSRSSNTPLFPSKCSELGSVSRLLPLPLSFTWTHIWIFQGVGSASFFILNISCNPTMKRVLPNNSTFWNHGIANQKWLGLVNLAR